MGKGSVNLIIKFLVNEIESWLYFEWFVTLNLCRWGV